MPGESLWYLLVGGALPLLGALGGIFLERRRLGFVIRDQAARNIDQARRLTDLERTTTKVTQDNRDLGAFLAILPEVVRHLNSHMSRRSIPPLLAATLERIFEPAQILVFTGRGEEELVLSAGKGVPEGLDRGLRVRVGHGRIGLAASHQMAMDRDDMHTESLFRRTSAEKEDPPGVVLDLIAPMVHERETLGVLCVGSPTRRHRDNKKMIKLIADLGALALQNHELFTELQNTANQDSLTNLSTKRFLNVRLGDLTHQAGLNHTPLSAIILDIDHFKRLNDTYGHLVGDEVLKAVAATLRSQVRKDDIPARYGGEEFVIVLPETSKQDAVRIAEKIREAIEAQPFPLKPGSPPRRGEVTLSGGVASFPEDATSSTELIGAADQALYSAKEGGRNRIVAYFCRYLSDDSDEEADAATG